MNYIEMENVMIHNIVTREEELLELLGIPWNGWGFEYEDFLELNSDLETSGFPPHKSFEGYLESRLEYKQRISA